MTMGENEQIDDIEAEIGNENVTINVPFNPNDINIKIVQQSIGQIVEKLQYDIILIPKYQRLPNLWSPKKKSRFIESLMLDLPIPLFYFDEGNDNDKKWRVVDGLQRISTLEHFILANRKDRINLSGNKAPLILQDLEFLTDYNGKTWDELPRDIKRRITDNQVTINLIGKGTPNQVKYNIFSRINQGGEPLSSQEIRTALFQGFRIDLLESLVSNTTEEGRAFIATTDGSVKSKRQEDLDFITRFISFYLIDYTKYQPDLDTFLTQGTERISENSSKQHVIKTDFLKSMSLSFEVFGKEAFRKRLNHTDSRKPINKSIFEVISSTFAKISDEERMLIQANKDEFRQYFVDLQHDKVFWDAITAGTATKESVINRHTKFNEMLNRFINATKSKNQQLQIS